MRKILLTLSIALLLTPLGYAQDAVKPAPNYQDDSSAKDTTAPTPNYQGDGSEKDYALYADAKGDRLSNTMVYLAAYVGVAIPIEVKTSASDMPMVSASLGVGVIFKKYLGLELNLGYSSNYYASHGSNSSYHYTIYNTRRYKDTQDMYNIKLYVTGNLPFNLGNSTFIPFIGAGVSNNFATLYWSDVGINSYNHLNSSFDFSVGPAAKLGLKYIYNRLLFELNVEYTYAYHKNNVNLSNIAVNAGFGFSF